MSEPEPLWDTVGAFAEQLWVSFERWPVVRRGPRQLIPSDVRIAVYKRDHFRCLFCGWAGRGLTLDHIVPWSAGGTDEPSNLRTLCWPCNEQRSNFRYCGDVGPRRDPFEQSGEAEAS